MKELTISGLIARVAGLAQDKGLDLSPSDVGWIVAAFLEGMAGAPPYMSWFDESLRTLADACMLVKDED